MLQPVPLPLNRSHTHKHTTAVQTYMIHV